MKKTTLTNQQERFLIFAMREKPKKYSKASMCQCLYNEFNIHEKSVARVIGTTAGYVINICSGYFDVKQWKDRKEEKKILISYFTQRLKEARTNIRLFEIGETENNPIYLVTLNGETPNKDSYLLHDDYLDIEMKKTARHKAKVKDYYEVDILLTKYAYIRIKDIIKLLKK